MKLLDGFPYRDMDDHELLLMTSIFSGPHIGDSDFVRSIFKLTLDNMFTNLLLKDLIDMEATACASVYDTDTQRSERMFRRGTLLYSAVLAQLAEVDTVPCKPNTFRLVSGSIGDELIWVSEERLKAEVPNYYRFIGEAATAIDIQSPIDHHLVVGGSGLIHLVTRDSQAIDEARSLELEYPDLVNELGSLFDELDK